MFLKLKKPFKLDWYLKRVNLGTDEHLKDLLSFFDEVVQITRPQRVSSSVMGAEKIKIWVVNTRNP